MWNRALMLLAGRDEMNLEQPRRVIWYIGFDSVKTLSLSLSRRKPIIGMQSIIDFEWITKWSLSSFAATESNEKNVHQSELKKNSAIETRVNQVKLKSVPRLSVRSYLWILSSFLFPFLISINFVISLLFTVAISKISKVFPHFSIA